MKLAMKEAANEGGKTQQVFITFNVISLLTMFN